MLEVASFFTSLTDDANYEFIFELLMLSADSLDDVYFLDFCTFWALLNLDIRVFFWTFFVSKSPTLLFHLARAAKLSIGLITFLLWLFLSFI